jgi:hypothetical protein
MTDTLDTGRYSGREEEPKEEFSQQETACARYDAFPPAVNDALAALGMWAAELMAENERLRAALEAVEWINMVPGATSHFWEDCPWCGGHRIGRGHWPDCQRQAALKESNDEQRS